MEKTTEHQSCRAKYISAARLADGTFAAVVLAEDATILQTIPLSARGHDCAVNPPRRQAVVFARRPGYFAAVLSLASEAPPHVFAPPEGRHFYGHGTFSADGKLLFATENDIDRGVGCIGVYETSAWTRTGEFPSHGIGPHQAILLPDGRTLAVANGGYATNPAFGRLPINLAEMEPSLSFIDVSTGALLVKHQTPETIRHLSIRHIAANAQGDVWFGAQWKGSLSESPALIGMASRDRPLKIYNIGRMPDRPNLELGPALKGYIGSVALSRDGRYFAASAPRAGRILFIDTETKELVRVVEQSDACGLSETGGNLFAVTSGLGVMTEEAPNAPSTAGREHHTLPLAFDNHLTNIS